jgi:CheY-like chemotaxis protein/anti-sigma regulatory factor (Ser/Thr protein kinase)
VLDLSKIEAGKMALHLETFDIQPMIEDIVTTLKTAAEKNANRIVLNLDDNIGSMHADVTKVRQILFNLVSNACKFTNHGSITLDVVRKTTDQDWITVRVIDTGIGMTPEHQYNLFQDFAQADTSIARRYGGTGLGLAISSRFAQMMRGNIRVESKLGEGATFIVELPALVKVDSNESARPATPAEPSSEVPEVVAADTVLIIDDDPAERDLMTRVLAKLGFDAISAASGAEGLRLAREIRPSIITLDVIMPGLNGWDVLTQLKADPKLATIPVIIITIVDDEAVAVSKVLTTISSNRSIAIAWPLSWKNIEAALHCRTATSSLYIAGEVNYAENPSCRRQRDEPRHAFQTAGTARIFRDHRARWPAGLRHGINRGPGPDSHGRGSARDGRLGGYPAFESQPENITYSNHCSHRSRDGERSG